MTSNAMNNRRCGSATGLGASCLLFVALHCEAQNLVPNHSFELRDTCREVNTWYTEETGPLGWFSAGGTGDYFMSCLPAGAFNGVPLSAWAFQYPQDGEAYVGVLTYDEAFGQREYFMVELTEPLVVGQTYYASMFANLTWGGSNLYPQLWVATNHMGMLFTMLPRPWSSGQPIPTGNNFAHLEHPWIITDTVDWTLVSGSFVADSAYRYVMIGNHFNNANTDTIRLGNFNWNPRGHTLIDNVCVTANPDGCPMALAAPSIVLDGVVLHPNPVQNEVGLSGMTIGGRVMIHDAMGRLLWQEDILRGPWRKDVRTWAKGSYILRLISQGKSRSFKFMLIE